MMKKKSVFSVICFVALPITLFSMNGMALASEEVIENKGAEYTDFKSQDSERQVRLMNESLIIEAPVITLPPLSEQTAAGIVKDQYLFNKVRIGVGRNISEFQNTAKTTSALVWEDSANGGVTSVVNIVSPGAQAVRLAIGVQRIPTNAEFRFFSMAEQDSTIILVSGKEIMELIDLNRSTDPTNPDNSTYWSPTVAGDSIAVEMYLPDATEVSELAISFPAITHMALSPFQDSGFSLQGYNDSDPCQNDATCYSSWANMRRATAKMIFNVGGSSYICTGTLLNDTDTTTWKPYFLSANHCIDNQTVASTLETLWFFESATCNSSSRNPNYTSLTGGATLLWTKGMSNSPGANNMDTSFFKLNGAMPGGVYFAGWTTAIPVGDRTGVHHPSGDWKKISFGLVDALRGDCWSTGSTSFSCQASDSGNFIWTDWNNGGTEGGSSGSAIFENNDQLAGDLTGGGGGNCAGSYSLYSLFRSAYQTGNLGRWLNAEPPEPELTLTPIYQLLLNNEPSEP